MPRSTARRVVTKRETKNITAHVPPGVPRGWLAPVVFDNDAEPKALPSYLKVRLDEEVHYDDRVEDHFTILEGHYEGRTGHVKRNRKDTSRFILRDPVHTGPAKIMFDRVNQDLWYENRDPVWAVMWHENAFRVGEYDLEIPVYPHGAGRKFGEYGLTWFRIGYSSEEFLHPGDVSAGCITVKNHEAWTDIYEYLITARKSNRSVGTIEVVELPPTAETLLRRIFHKSYEKDQGWPIPGPR